MIDIDSGRIEGYSLCTTVSGRDKDRGQETYCTMHLSIRRQEPLHAIFAFKEVERITVESKLVHLQVALKCTLEPNILSLPYLI